MQNKYNALDRENIIMLHIMTITNISDFEFKSQIACQTFVLQHVSAPFFMKAMWTKNVFYFLLFSISMFTW